MVLNDVYRVMAIDALATSHPLSTPASEINMPAQISEVFDSISYSKVPRLCGGDTARALGASALVQWGHTVWLAPHSLLSPSPPPSPGSLRPQDALQLPD